MNELNKEEYIKQLEKLVERLEDKIKDIEMRKEWYKPGVSAQIAKTPGYWSSEYKPGVLTQLPTHFKQ
jgi:hypothetical protein